MKRRFLGGDRNTKNEMNICRKELHLVFICRCFSWPSFLLRSTSQRPPRTLQHSHQTHCPFNTNQTNLLPPTNSCQLSKVKSKLNLNYHHNFTNTSCLNFTSPLPSYLKSQIIVRDFWTLWIRFVHLIPHLNLRFCHHFTLQIIIIITTITSTATHPLPNS